MRLITGLAAACCLGLTLVLITPGTASAEPVADATFTAMSEGLVPFAGDEFDGPAGAPPDPAIWNVATGGGGWGNREQQVYTSTPDNVRLDGAGHLVLEATDVDGQLTSSRIDTDGRVDITTGVIAARIKMPEGQGLHPAFWLLGSDLQQVGYPASGEIDVIELVNSGTRAYFSVHGPMEDPEAPKWKLSNSVVLDDLSADFHTYWLSKQPGRLVVGIDDTPMATFVPADLPADARWVQDAPFFALLNLAVAGEWPGPVAPGVLPAQMLVDWVRFLR